MIKPTFAMFVEYCEQRKLPTSEWVFEPGIRIYVRKGWRPRHGDYVLANMEATTPGKGALTKFLDTWEPKYQFSVEQILNERLIPYFERRGYVYESGKFPGSLCMIGPKS
jgi:hypothetical protein